LSIFLINLLTISSAINPSISAFDNISFNLSALYRDIPFFSSSSILFFTSGICILSVFILILSNFFDPNRFAFANTSFCKSVNTTIFTNLSCYSEITSYGHKIYFKISPVHIVGRLRSSVFMPSASRLFITTFFLPLYENIDFVLTFPRFADELVSTLASALMLAPHPLYVPSMLADIDSFSDLDDAV